MTPKGTEPVKPALTAEEWAKALPSPEKYEMYVGETPEIRHYLAALNLYGQPFGFTRDDIENLRLSAPELGPYGDALYALADRIESLLPPELPEKEGT